MLGSARRQLDGAGRILKTGVYPAARDEAYEAMLKAGMSLVLAHGYRVEAGSHHLTTVRVISKLLGPGHRGLAKAFNDLRKSRHERLYDGVDFCTAEEASRAIDRASELLALIEAKIGK